jgi:hypothetical protein
MTDYPGKEKTGFSAWRVQKISFLHQNRLNADNDKQCESAKHLIFNFHKKNFLMSDTGSFFRSCFLVLRKRQIQYFNRLVTKENMTISSLG